MTRVLIVTGVVAGTALGLAAFVGVVEYVTDRREWKLYHPTPPPRPPRSLLLPRDRSTVDV